MYIWGDSSSLQNDWAGKKMSSFVTAGEDESQECRCNTCKGIFSSIEKAKEHYRSDWHVLNSKRRAASLPPLSKDEFKKALPNIKPHMKSERIESKRTDPITEIEISEDIPLDVITTSPSNSLLMKMEPNDSIFDQKSFETVDECVEYMAITYGFFIPDIEYLTDREGMLIYLHNKVKVGQICLYCQKSFKSPRACQDHMITMSHCKIAYDDGEGGDFEEFEDFYDFSSTHDAVEYDSDGELIEDSLEVSAIGELILPDGRILGHRAFRYEF